MLGVVGMGMVQQQFFPDSSRPEILVDLWYPEGTSYAANEEVTKRVEARMLKLERRRRRDHLGRQRRPSASCCVLDQIFPQSNVSQMIVHAEAT